MKDFNKLLYDHFKKKIFYYNRSITGDGVRKTLADFKKFIPNLQIKYILSGTKVFDWIVPPEWNVSEAYVLDKNNKKIIDFKKNNLHLVSYSKKIKKNVSKKIFLRHLYSNKKKPEAIPYITSYYKKIWGFCVSDYEKKKIIKKYYNTDKFKILIKSNHNYKGKLNYAEVVLKGKSSQEILISTYICHPSMANNELSGPIISLFLINFFKKYNLNKTLRFIFVPETIGSISYLHSNLKYLKKKTIAGLNLSCLGYSGEFSYISTKQENSIFERILKNLCKKKKINLKKYSFLDRGSDERQYNSPGVDLPVITICRKKFNNFYEYHTSLDNFELVKLENLNESFRFIKKIIIEADKNLYPKSNIICEPFLFKRRLVSNLSSQSNTKLRFEILNFIQYSDMSNSLFEIAKKIKISKKKSTNILKYLVQNNLVEV